MLRAVLVAKLQHAQELLCLERLDREWREGHKENDPPTKSISRNQLQQVDTVNDLANYSEERNKKGSFPFKEDTTGVAGGEGTLALLTHSLTHSHRMQMHAFTESVQL